MSSQRDLNWMTADRALDVRRAFTMVLVEPDAVFDVRVSAVLRQRICAFVEQARIWEWDAAQTLDALRYMAEDCRLKGDCVVGITAGSDVEAGLAKIIRACIDHHFHAGSDPASA